MTKEKVFKKILIGIAFGLAVSIVTPVSIPGEQIRVEAAKKDKKKPKIKLTGAKELTATVGEQVTIPATTYSDNKTKKKKLKVGVTVKKGNKNYKALASKIRKATLKSKPVSVTFGEEGTYKITTTVTDLSKNKATAVRTVTITPKQIEEQVTTKQDPVVTTTTEEQKHEETKREEKSSEESAKKEPQKPMTSEESFKEETQKTQTSEENEKVEQTKQSQSEEKTAEKIEENETEEEIHDEEEEDVRKGVATVNGKTVLVNEDGADYSDFDCRKEEINGKIYTIISDNDFKELIYKSQIYTKNMKINVENKIDTFFINYDSPMSENSSYLNFFGDISATDAEGNDISKNIAIYEPEVFKSNSPDSDAVYDRCIMYCVDSEGKGCIYNYYLSFRGNQEYLASKFTKINDDPFVYVSYKEDSSTN